MEIFYDLAITPWLQFSPSVQHIQSAVSGVDESVVVATRLHSGKPGAVQSCRL